MHIISVMNQKGGSGKTTVALHLARGLQLAGKTVQVLDVDRQRSATKWAAKGKRFGRVGPDVTAGTVADLDTMNAEVVVVDTAGDFRADAQGQAMAILRRAALVVVPVLPTPLDVDGAEDLLHALTAARTAGVMTARVVVVVNKATRSRLTTQARAALAHYGHPLLVTSLSDRVAYAEELGYGGTAFDRKPSDKARQEVTQFISEIGSI
jgi:chromosome partitioning protein